MTAALGVGWLPAAAGGLALAVGGASLLLARSAPHSVPASAVRPARGLSWLVLLAGALLLAAVVVRVLAGPGSTVRTLWVLGGLLVLPTALALYPDGRPPRVLGWAGVAPVTATGLLALALPVPYAVGGISGSAAFLLLGALLWWRHEHADERARQAVLWLALGGGIGTLLAVLVGFVVGGLASALVGTGFVVAGLSCLFIGVLRPDLTDVRALILGVVVHLVSGLVLLSCFTVVVSGTAAVTGTRPSAPGVLGLLAAVLAAGYHPLTTALRRVTDRLLFGDRRAPLAAVSHVGRHLGDDPVVVLRSLRESLALPWVALEDGEGTTVAWSGPPGQEHVVQPLRPDDPALGRLRVGLRPGERTLPARDVTVLAVLAPALGQLVQARALAAAVQESRREVVRAVEDERRRLRRDLHDGLGPRLTGVAYTADAARNLLHADPGRADRLLVGVRTEAGEAIAEVRRLVEGLRPPSLDQVGLVEALRQHARTLMTADGLPLDVVVETEDHRTGGAGGSRRDEGAASAAPLDAAVEVAAYRIVVEALTNVARHSGARHSRVRLVRDEHALVVEVTDDGASRQPWTPGVGLASMLERAEMLGGSLSTGSGRVTARLPV